MKKKKIEYNKICMDEFNTMSEEEQLHCVEQALIELWESGVVELVGFDENKQPLFKLKEPKHG
jgi:hypothetical protein